MDDIQLSLAKHEQRIATLEREMGDFKKVQTEIRAMNETLVMLANELKHTNEHLSSHERKLEQIDSQPKERLQQIATAIIAALAGGLISIVLNNVIK